MAVPLFFVKIKTTSQYGYEREEFAAAHLRNRKGYMYLVWRMGKRVCSYYVGKRKN